MAHVVNWPLYFFTNYMNREIHLLELKASLLSLLVNSFINSGDDILLVKNYDYRISGLLIRNSNYSCPFKPCLHDQKTRKTLGS